MSADSIYAESQVHNSHMVASKSSGHIAAIVFSGMLDRRWRVGEDVCSHSPVKSNRRR